MIKELLIVVRELKPFKPFECQLMSYCANCRNECASDSWRGHNCTGMFIVKIRYLCYHCGFYTKKENRIEEHLHKNTKCGSVRSSNRLYEERKQMHIDEWACFNIE